MLIAKRFTNLLKKGVLLGKRDEVKGSLEAIGCDSWSCNKQRNDPLERFALGSLPPHISSMLLLSVSCLYEWHSLRAREREQLLSQSEYCSSVFEASARLPWHIISFTLLI